MAALQYVHIKGYAALILRRTYQDLNLPDAIMHRAKSWLQDKVPWDEQNKRFTFPSGGILQFGYCDNENDLSRYKSAAFQTICVDEVTEWPEAWYTFLFSRLRKKQGMDVPLRMRAATNPDGIGQLWVMRRFGIGENAIVENPIATDDRVFLPARVDDNPSLNLKEYERSLSKLSHNKYMQLRWGKWIRDGEGLVYGSFDVAKNVIDHLPDLVNRPVNKLDYYILGIDYGYTDATAFSVLGWLKDNRTVYVCESFKENSLTPSQAAEVAKALNDKYQFVRMVGDIGGLGKAYAEEARDRFSLPIEAAEKQNKRGYIDLLNGALSARQIKLVRHTTEQLQKEWLELPWQKGRRKEEAEALHKEAEGFENHCSDSCLYAWRACVAYGEEEPTKMPQLETKRYYDVLERMLVEQMEEKYGRTASQNWWEVEPGQPKPFQKRGGPQLPDFGSILA
jgi:hypothetical protein